MSSNAESNMSGLKRVWTRIVRIFEALEGMDDPTGDYMLSLGKRVDKLERDLERLEGQRVRAATSAQ
jgi:hypothetical protein